MSDPDPHAHLFARAGDENAVTLAAIAKAPAPGSVKTRLCPPCSFEQAAELARASLLDTLVTMLETPAARHVLVLDGCSGDWLEEIRELTWAGSIELEVIPQAGDGLGERLAQAFADIGGPTLVIGMDTPQITPKLLAEGLRQLAVSMTDAVLGEAGDGGYWAIGLKRPDSQVFAGVPMSSTDTASVQRKRLRELGLRTTELPVVRDFDCFEDALEVAALAPDTRFARALAPIGERLAGAAR